MFNIITGFFERRRLAKAQRILAAAQAEQARKDAQAARMKKAQEDLADALIASIAQVLENIVTGKIPK